MVRWVGGDESVERRKREGAAWRGEASGNEGRGER